MTPEQIARDRHLCTMATPGPWDAYHRCAGLTADHDETIGLGLEVKGPPEAAGRGMFARGADARFIAAARTRWPAALDELDTLRAALDAIANHPRARRDDPLVQIARAALDGGGR